MSIRKDLGIISHECNHCGKCCQRRGEVSLTPLDVYNISRYLQLTPKEFVESYCDIGNGFDVQIRCTNESDRTCIFFDRDINRSSYCRIYNVRPMTCYLYPLKSRPESKNSFFIDSSAHCPSSAQSMTFSEYVDKASNGRYAEDFEHHKKFCMAVGAFYSDRNSPSETAMFEFFFYNNSIEELKKKIDKYLFGK